MEGERQTTGRNLDTAFMKNIDHAKNRPQSRPEVRARVNCALPNEPKNPFVCNTAFAGPKAIRPPCRRKVRPRANRVLPNEPKNPFVCNTEFLITGKSGPLFPSKSSKLLYTGANRPQSHVAGRRVR